MKSAESPAFVNAGLLAVGKGGYRESWLSGIVAIGKGGGLNEAAVNNETCAARLLRATDEAPP